MRTSTLSLALIISLTGCQYGRYTPAEDVGTIPGGTMPTIGTTPTTPVTTPVDNDVDGDGFDNEASGGDDCNDNDAAVNPDATDDTCDGVDQNCDEFDGTVSPEARAASACGGVDTDGDGFMDVDGDGEIVDCDDTNPAINPLADEIWYDGVDQNCNADDDFDQDMDGHASDDFAGDDCNDLDSSVSPSDAEVLDDGVDQNCDPTDDTSGNGIVDDDLDGYALADDCDDANPAINPGAIEIAYNGIDENCDTKDITDVDCDGVALLDESGNVLDCDDNLDTVYPNAPEVLADGVDQDCDGVDGAAPVVDTDGDGSEDNLDCADSDATIHPGALEVTDDGIDNDCNPLTVDESVEEACVGGYSEAHGTFTAPVGATILTISGERVGTLNGDDYLSWSVWTTGTPIDMVVTSAGNVAEFTFERCVDDAADWKASVAYTLPNVVDTQYDCMNDTFTGTWAVDFNGDIQTVSVSPHAADSGCDAIW